MAELGRPRYKYAVVAELVDALASGASSRKRVGVRLSPTAPRFVTGFGALWERSRGGASPPVHTNQ